MSAIAHNQVSVGTTAGGTVIAAGRSTRRTITIIQHGTTAVFLGVGTVTTTNGFLLAGVVGASVTLYTNAEIKGIVASGTQTVSYFEEYE